MAAEGRRENRNGKRAVGRGIEVRFWNFILGGGGGWTDEMDSDRTRMRIKECVDA